MIDDQFLEKGTSKKLGEYQKSLYKNTAWGRGENEKKI